MQRDYEQFQQRDIEIVVIGPESRSAFERYWRKHDFPFVGLADPEHKVLNAYGQEFKLFKLGRMPAQVLVDKGGLVRQVHYGESMRDIPQNSTLFEWVDQITAYSAR